MRRPGSHDADDPGRAPRPLAPEPTTPASSTMSKLMGDPRIDPRLKEYLASVTDPNALPTGPSDALWSGEGLEERDIAIRSAPDGNEIYLRVARPAGDEVLGCVYWIHGGGMAQGSAYDVRTIPRARMLAHLGVAVVAVDFRNCAAPPCDAAVLPEGFGTTEVAPYPAGLNDCYSGLQWVQDHAAELRIDQSQTIVAGRKCSRSAALFASSS